MRVLVTGAAGFVGAHATDELLRGGHEVVSFDTRPVSRQDVQDHVTGDLLDAPLLRETIRRHQIDACLHLAGIAFVPMAWTDPQLVMRVNVNGALSLLEAFRSENPEARMLVVTSAEVYGREPRPCVKENDPLVASNLYAVSKIAADTSALLYARHYRMPVMTARPQNHIGPGQSKSFVVSAFAEQLIRLRQAPPPHVMQVGNLESRRDFTDVRDVARAYRLLLEKGTGGEAYNIASGQTMPVRDLLDKLCAIAGIRPERQLDQNRYRPTDEPPVLSIEKITTDTGWMPVFLIEQTLRDIFVHLEEQATSLT